MENVFFDGMNGSNFYTKDGYVKEPVEFKEKKIGRSSYYYETFEDY